jgi:hypothetical protein
MDDSRPSDQLLGPLGAEAVWHAPTARHETHFGVGALMESQWDINKMAHYLPVYDQVFMLARNHPVTLLEIGVNFGGSLELWRRCFGHPAARIVGIDTNRKCRVFDDPDRNVFVRIGAQQDTEFLDAVIDELGPFDFIIDDGSHIPDYTLTSFTHLFAYGLNQGGSYVVEDLHTCYATDVPSHGTPPFTEVLKMLIDLMHRHYTQVPTGDEFTAAVEPGHPGYRDSWTVPAGTFLISGLEVYDSLAVIRKGPRSTPRMIRRWSPERMTEILNPDAALFLLDNPHLGEAAEKRFDWFSPEESTEQEWLGYR